MVLSIFLSYLYSSGVYQHINIWKLRFAISISLPGAFVFEGFRTDFPLVVENSWIAFPLRWPLTMRRLGTRRGQDDTLFLGGESSSTNNPYRAKQASRLAGSPYLMVGKPSTPTSSPRERLELSGSGLRERQTLELCI